MLIPFRRVCVVALITLELFQINVNHGRFDNLVALSASSAKVESVDQGTESAINRVAKLLVQHLKQLVNLPG